MILVVRLSAWTGGIFFSQIPIRVGLQVGKKKVSAVSRFRDYES